MTLTEFLLARIAEDEAGEEIHHPIYDGHMEPLKVRVEKVVPSARWQRKCEADRRIVGLFHVDDGDGDGWNEAGAQVLRALALPYSEHPDYRDEWRP